MDYDVSCKIGDYRIQRNKYNNVINELHKLIEFNVLVKYIQSFQFYKCLLVNSHTTIIKKQLYTTVNDIFHSKHKSRYLHDWPSKPPTFEANLHSCEYIHRRKDSFNHSHPTMKQWRYKSYPPNKVYYPLTTLTMY